jgi:hypothetical protein
LIDPDIHLNKNRKKIWRISAFESMVTVIAVKIRTKSKTKAEMTVEEQRKVHFN